MRVSLKSVLWWSFFLVFLLLAVQFLAELETSPIVWNDDGLSFSRELREDIGSLRNMLGRYIYWIFGIYVLIAAGVILLEEQNPDRAIIWLGTLLLFPFVGLAAYVIIGPNVRSAAHRWRVRKSLRHRSGTHRPPGPAEPGASRLQHLLAASCDAVPTIHNDVEILLNGERTFDAIEKALHDATDYIHMEYFSVASDELGTRIKNLLIDRARAGVKVRVLYDAVGSWHVGRAFLKELQDAGVEIYPFMPTAFARFRSTINNRDHRKIVVADGRVGFVGGLNIGDMYLGRDPKMGNWRDTHIQITGEAVRELNRAFLSHWDQCTAKYMDYREFSYAPAGEMEGAPLTVTIATSGPGKDFRAIADGYFHMIVSAQKRIWITTPYLVPGASISEALSIAAKSGIDVRILIPSKADHTLVFWASQFNVDQLLQSGIRIFSYQDGFIHAKTALMDESVVSVGTTNLDLRSLEVNYEVQAFIQSRDVAKKFEHTFLDDLKKSEEETLAKRRARPFHRKLQGAIGRLWSSLL
jgi:cardiolipin synthase